MSSLALMRWLESAPGRYDSGMRVLTLGRVGRIQDAAAEAAVRQPGAHVLEIGCGTGSITARLLARGARVTALDQNPEMLEQTRARLAEAAPGSLELVERTASELDAWAGSTFDAVVAGFCLSEMSSGERAYVLGGVAPRLTPGGVLVIADEVRPSGPFARALLAAARLPQAALAWLLAGRVSTPIPDLAAELREAGFELAGERRWLLGSLGLFVARRPA